MSKNKRLLELFRESKEPNFIKFLDGLEKDGVIIAEHIFAEKKRQDDWWKDALDLNKKVNNVEDKDE